MTTRKLGLMLAAALAFSIAEPVQADPILFNFTTTLTLRSGADVSGLVGATISVNVLFDSNAQYVAGIAGLAEVVSESASVTISGSSDDLNNQTYALPTLDFYAKQGVLDADPTNQGATVNLEDGGTLVLNIHDYATSHGTSVVVGDTVNTLDFAPTTSFGTGFSGFDQSTTVYNLSNVVITAGEVPEPSSLVLCGAAGLTGLLVARRRRRWTPA